MAKDYLKIGGHGVDPLAQSGLSLQEWSGMMDSGGHYLEIVFEHQTEKIVGIKISIDRGQTAFEWTSP